MNPIYQTVFGAPLGNCFPACLASILECPIERFPFPPYEDNWLQQVDNYLKTIGWAYIEFTPKMAYCWTGRFLCIVCGKSPRGFSHSVVAEHFMDNDMHAYKWIHDPHPDGGWVKDVDGIGILVPTHIKEI